MGKTARVRDIEIAYDDNERAGARAVMLLHGFPFNRSLWREQAAALDATHRVIAPDLRGFGETTVTSGQTTMETLAEDVAALLDQLGVRRVVLGGLSMGGYVALAFLRAHPERVRALVLADTRPQGDTEEARQTREQTARQALDEGMTAIEKTMLPKLLAPSTFERDPHIVERVREMILDTSPEGAAAALRGMAVRRDQTELLAEIKVPTLIVVGAEDTLTPVKDSETMHAQISGSLINVIEGAAHVSNVERPAEFNRALGDFLGALPPEQGTSA
jgi:3-oxoadipate enol-lactonase